MAEELYVNARGFKCVKSQLAKTSGRDPQEHAAAQLTGTDHKLLKVKAAEYNDA